MTSIELFIGFLAATAAFAFLPGPALLYTAAQTMARGRRAGFMAALGIHVGGYGHVALATLGLAALLTAVPTAYFAMKIGGALYLIWLGVRLILAPQGAPTVAGAKSRSARRAFIDSVVVELLNPKVALFFVAFLPQFVDPSAEIAIWAQFLILGVIVNLMFSSADIVAVLLSDKIMSKARSSATLVEWAQRGAGALLCGLGANLALQRG